MFDEDDYVSDEDENVMYSSKNVASSNVLGPSSGPEFNNMAGDGESLLKMMKDRVTGMETATPTATVASVAASATQAAHVLSWDVASSSALRFHVAMMKVNATATAIGY